VTTDVVTNVCDFRATGIDGSVVDMSAFRGQVLLIVNVASHCGYTPQYVGLEQLYRRHASRGFSVLGFPCNQFGRQEPGTNDEIWASCTTKYGVSFPLFAKIDVNGPGAHPLYQFLKAARKGLFGSGTIKWNFTKFLVDRAGQPIKRYGSTTPPEGLDADIVKALNQ
jgi:glutathione peroxidase